MRNSIEKNVELDIPVSKVWDALTDSEKFGEWFRVKLDGPFEEGKTIHGHITYPGYEHLKWEAFIENIEPERKFSFTWHPYAIDPDKDYSKESSTVVEFHLEATSWGTRLKVTESGFNKIPSERREKAYEMNEGGWSEQMKNINAYLTGGHA